MKNKRIQKQGQNVLDSVVFVGVGGGDICMGVGVVFQLRFYEVVGDEFRKCRPKCSWSKFKRINAGH